MVGRPRRIGARRARQRGDLDAYDQLVREHQGIAFRTAYVITGSAADAEEVVQDAFVKAYRARGRFRSGAPFRPWLLAIVANEARNRRRAYGAAGAAVVAACRGAPLRRRGPVSGGGAPRPRGARASCSPRSTGWGRSSGGVACRYFLGLSEAETAAVLGCRPGTVKSRLSRALARLEEEL